MSNPSPTEMEPSSLKKKDNPQLSSTLVKQFPSQNSDCKTLNIPQGCTPENSWDLHAQPGFEGCAPGELPRSCLTSSSSFVLAYPFFCRMAQTISVSLTFIWQP